MIDFIMVNHRFKSIITACRTFQRADVGSDHNLLLAGIRVKLRKIPKKPVTKRFDVEKLSDLTLRAQYAEHIEKKVDVIRKHQGSAEET